MAVLPLTTVAEYSETVALGVGILFVALVVGYAIVSRSAGREADEWEQEQAVNGGLSKLSHSEQATADSVDTGFLNDLAWLCETSQTVSRRTRLRQWCRRQVPRGLVGHGRRIEDADGRPIHIISINGRRLAHRDPDALLEDAETVSTAVADVGTPPATLSERYYDDIVDGFVDIEETKSRVRGSCQTRIEANMRRNRNLDYEELYDRLVFDDGFRYPPAMVHEKLEQLEGRDIRRRKDGTVTYQRFS